MPPRLKDSDDEKDTQNQQQYQDKNDHRITFRCCYFTNCWMNFVPSLFHQKHRKSHSERNNNTLFFFLLFMLVAAVLSSSVSLFIQRHQDNIHYHLRENFRKDFYVHAQGYLPSVDTVQQALTVETMRSDAVSFVLCNNSFTPFNLTFYVGKLHNQITNSPNDEVCGLTDPCSSMNEVFDQFSSLLLKDMETYACLYYHMTIVVLNDLTDTSSQSTSNCKNTVPEVKKSHNRVRVDLTVTSVNHENPSTITCFYEEDGERLEFITDISAIVFLYLYHIKMKNIYLNPLTVQHATIINSNVDIARALDSAVIENSDFLESRILIATKTSASLRNIKLSGGLMINQCSQILIVNLTCYEDDNAKRYGYLEISTVDDFLMRDSNLLFGLRGHANFDSVISIAIIDSNFEYVSTSPSRTNESLEYVISVELVFRLNILGCTFSKRNDGQGWLKVVSGGVIYFSHLHVANNTCDVEGLFLLNICQSIRISDSSFLNNVANMAGALYIIAVKDLSIVDSSFDNNYAVADTGAVGITQAFNSRIKGCKFRNNTANNGSGGALSLKYSEMFISHTTFVRNRATISGGAIYSYSSWLTAVEFCTFEENTAQYQVYDESCFDTSSNPHGSGGAIAMYYSTSDTFMETSFVGNKASRGGAVFISNDIRFIAIKFENNFASISGGALFVTNKASMTMRNVSMLENIATIYGPDSSTPIAYFSEIVETIPPTSSSDIISIYPGQIFIVKFMKMYDRYNNYIKSVKECPTLSLSDNRFLLESNFTQLDSNVITLTITIDPSIDIGLNNYGISNTLNIGFIESDTHNLTILLTSCPTDYVIKNGKCAPGFPFSQVIPGIIIGSLLFMLIGIILGSFLCSLCGFGAWRAFKKVRSIYARQRSEKEIEEKLLTYDVSYGSLNSEIHISKTSNYIIPANDLKFEKKIGEGASGSVYQAKYNMIDVAVKSIIRTEETDEIFEKEVMLLVQLRHPNIISFYGICISETQMYIVVELGKNGSLEQLITNMKKGKIKKTLKEKLKILIGVANGMKYLHGLNPQYLIHRDLKPANIVLDQSNVPKVCDFGLSRTVSSSPTKSLTTNIGTLIYMCPELILEDDSEPLHQLSRENATKIDVYSYAIIMYELFYEETAYWNENSEKINYFNHLINEQKKVKSLNLLFYVANHDKRPFIPFLNYDEMKIWCDKFMSNDDTTNDELLIAVDSYMKLMKSCWASNPSDRPSFERIIQKLTDIYNMDF
ncbi:hypothetical protein C9374_008758 [Naegleria lovaniensis]|uniref:Protein kinase domain-containing protein n=1 Tax=Naegleria lovaniensis TaxID=51637 RepID=A0AA88GJ43_NAELO|nr:uncharacterized protein C9374_008758 [Naegleria lovaniensis]KAG2378136.1 hypothetical protein C9374_008758 [Naegleria lovaniensis]